MTIFGYLRVGLVAVGCGVVAHAQTVPCAIRSTTQTVKLLYPPIARAAHVSGVVVVRAEFAADGRVTKAEAWSGPLMLRANAVAFVAGLEADAYSNVRACPIAVSFQMDDTLPKEAHDAQNDIEGFVETHMSSDVQHYAVVGKTVPIYAMSDPAGKIIRKKFLGVF